MIEEPKTLTIKRPDRRPTPDQIAAFQGAPTSFVTDAMDGKSALDMAIRPLAPDHLPGHVAGPALTAGNSPGDIMATLAALNFIQEGDVVIAAFGGHRGCAAAGDRVSAMMKNCGAAGFVTDGPMRDWDGIVAAGLPCWCTGLNPNSPFTTGPGNVGLPIQIGGHRVETGDMIVADRDGVVVVPFDQIPAVAERLAKVRELEMALDAELSAGLKIPDGVKALIEGDGVEFV
ncbi:MAG: RraA family protein [Paracoccaceae bacterium]